MDKYIDTQTHPVEDPLAEPKRLIKLTSHLKDKDIYLNMHLFKYK